MKKVLDFIVFIIFGTIIISCSSLVYSPSINLPDKIQKDETKLSAAYEYLPFTLKTDAGRYFDNGIVVSLQHSYSDRFCMQVKYWTDVNTYGVGDTYKHGASIISYIRLNAPNAAYKFYLAPTIGMSLEDNRIQMGTLGSWLAVQCPQVTFLEPYAAAGFIYGNTDLKNNYWGFGIMANLGTYIPVYNKLKLNIELSSPTLFNMTKSITTIYLTPTIGFYWGL
ncbi:MAG: hypothetical protein ABSG15_08185 [FCB group bacterium]|jgi:hypothetical protein